MSSMSLRNYAVVGDIDSYRGTLFFKVFDNRSVCMKEERLILNDELLYVYVIVETSRKYFFSMNQSSLNDQIS